MEKELKLGCSRVGMGKSKGIDPLSMRSLAVEPLSCRVGYTLTALELSIAGALQVLHALARAPYMYPELLT